MGKKHYKPSVSGFVMNQAMQINQLTYNFHYQNLYELALNRMKWLNLPRGCDARFLEEALLTYGSALLFQDPLVKDMFYTTRIVASGPLSVYNKPTKFRSIGNNGWNISVPYNNGIQIFETNSRFTTMGYIALFANRLTDLDRTRDVNLKVQKTPYIITGPEEKQTEITNVLSNIDNNEIAVIGVPGLSDIDIKVLNLNVPFLYTELTYAKQLLYNEFMTCIGIDNDGMSKQERMTEKEVVTSNGQIMAKRLNFEMPRREALAIAKKRYPEYFKDTQLVWNTDNTSDNYNFTNNIEKQMEVK